MEKRKNYHHGDLRDALLEAVRELVERDGPDGFSVADACRMAGVSTAAPYRHFKDREEILRGVVQLGMWRLRDAMAEAAAAYPAGHPLRIVGIGRTYFDFAHKEPGMFRLIFSHTQSHQEDEALKQTGDQCSGIVEEVVADHLNIAADSDEARLRAYSLWCFVHGHCFLTLDGKVEPTMTHEQEQGLLHLVGEAILPPSRAHAPAQMGEAHFTRTIEETAG